MQNQNNPQVQETDEGILEQSQNRNSNDNNKIIKSIIIIFIIIIILTFVSFSIYKFFSLINQNFNNSEDNNELNETNDDIIIDISYTINDILIYNYTNEKKINIKINESPFLFGKRNLKEKEQKTLITATFIFNIYDIDKSKNPNIYYAYAIIENMNKEKLNKINPLINQINSDNPIMKISFYANGTINSLQIPDNINSTFALYLYEFIEKIIPDLSTNPFTKNNNYNKNEVHYNNKTVLNDNENIFSYWKNENNTGILYIEKNNYKNNTNENTKHKNYKISFNNNKIDKVISKSETIIKVNNNYKFDDYENCNFTLNEDDYISNRKFIIDEYTESSNSVLNLISYKQDKIYSNQIKELSKLKKYQNFKSNLNSLRNLTHSINEINKLSIDNFRNLETLIIDPFYQPIFFNYPFFNLNILGMIIGLNAKVHFFPSLGLFNIQIYLNRNGEEIKIFNKEHYTNFNEIIFKIDKIIDDSIKIIKNIIKNELDNEYDLIEKEINNILDEFIVGFNQNDPKFSKYFEEPLSDLFTAINYASVNGYQNLYNEINNTKYKFDDLLNDINNKNQHNVNNILLISENSIDEYILNLTNILLNESYIVFNSTQIFIDSIKNDINEQIFALNENHLNLSNFNFDIITYYDIIDLLTYIYNMYSSFTERINNIIILEKENYINYINELFTLVINPSLKIIEKISYLMKSDSSIIKSIYLYYGEENGNSIIEYNTKIMDSYRGKINEILQNILVSINDIYVDNILINNSNFKSILDEYNIQLEEIQQNGTELINIMKQYINLENNFTLYNNDIDLLFSIYLDTIKTRQISFQINIIDKINSIEKVDFNKEFSEINEILDIYINNIILLTLEFNFDEEKVFLNEFINQVKFIKESYLDNLIPNKIKENYINADFNNMCFNYYNDVIKAYEKFNTIFLEENFKKHIEFYISNPIEIEIKLNDIKNNQQKEIEDNIFKIFSLIYTKINNDIKDNYQKFSNLLKDKLNLFYNYAEKSYYIENETIYDNYHEIELIFKEAFNLLNDENNTIKVSEFENDKNQFNLYSNLSIYENQITSNLENIINYISEINKIKKENNLTIIEQKNYKRTILKGSINYLENLIEISKDIINQSTLQNLNSNEFLNLYIKHYDYTSEELISNINNIIAEIKNKTDEYMKPFIIPIQNEINNEFAKRINVEGFNDIINIVANEIFIDPLIFQKNISIYLNEPIGPKTNIISIFNNERDIINEKTFFFDSSLYELSYSEIIKNMNQLYFEKRELILNEIKLNNSVKELIINKIDLVIDNAFINIKEKISSLSQIEHLEFLSSFYSLEEITKETIENYKFDLKVELSNQIENNYNNYFINLKKKIKQNLDNQYNEIIQIIDSQYNITYNLFSKKSTSNKIKDSINELNPLTKENLLKVINNFINKINNIYYEENLMIEINTLQKTILDKLNIPISFGNFDDTISYDIQIFQNIGRSRIFNERIELKSNINNLLEKGINITIINFFNNHGKNYIEKIFEEDYNNIELFLKFLSNNINDTYNYMDYLLNDDEIIEISESFYDKIKDIYNIFNVNIYQFLTLKVENIIFKKINEFKEQFHDLMFSYFAVKLKNQMKNLNSNPLLINKKVIDFIPLLLSENFFTKEENIINEMIEPIIIEPLKNKYKNKIDSYLNKTTEILKEYNEKIKEKSLIAFNKYKNKEMVNINKNYKTFENIIKSYNDNILFEINENKKEEIKNIFNKEINENLKNISDIFINEQKIQDENLMNVLNKFNTNFILDNVINEISNNQLGDILNLIGKKLLLKVDDLSNRIYQKFSNFSTLLMEENNIKINAFSEQNKIRNLDEIELFQINQMIKLIETKYINFTNKLLNTNKFQLIETKKGTFQTLIKKSSEQLSEHFYTYHIMLSQYTNIDNIFSNIEEQGEEIRKILMNFLIEQTQNIDNIIYSYKTKLNLSWETLKILLSKEINNSLNEIYKYIFSDLNQFNSNEIKEEQNSLLINPLYLYNEYDEVIVYMNFMIKNIKMSYGYSIVKINDFNFKINVHVYGSIDVKLSSIIDDFYMNIIEGKIGSGMIGIEPIYYLKDKSVEVDAYVKYEESMYKSSNYEFNYENNWQKESEKEILIPVNDDIHIIKIFKIYNN